MVQESDPTIYAKSVTLQLAVNPGASHLTVSKEVWKTNVDIRSGGTYVRDNMVFGFRILSTESNAGFYARSVIIGKV